MTDRSNRFDRRKLLYAVGAATLGLLAGCAEEEADDDAADGGIDDDEMDDNEMDDDATDDDEAVDDEEMGDDETDDDAMDDEEMGDDEETDDDEADTGARLRDVLSFENQYVMESEFDGNSGTWTFHEGDWHLVGEFEGEQVETYRIQAEGEVVTYSISDGDCFRMTGESDQEDVFDPTEPEEDSEEYFSSGTTTVDGQEVYIFEVEDGTYYVSVSTGYPVRFEGDRGEVVTLHSWGETEPISPPDMECMDI